MKPNFLSVCRHLPEQETRCSPDTLCRVSEDFPRHYMMKSFHKGLKVAEENDVQVIFHQDSLTLSCSVINVCCQTSTPPYRARSVRPSFYTSKVWQRRATSAVCAALHDAFPILQSRCERFWFVTGHWNKTHPLKLGDVLLRRESVQHARDAEERSQEARRETQLERAKKGRRMKLEF